MRHYGTLILIVLAMNVLAFYSFDPTTSFTGAQVTTVSGNVSFTVLPAEVCQINFGNGWNLVSVCANVSNTSISSVFDQIENDVRFILEWDETTQLFQVFSPLQASPPFSTINVSKSYFVYYDNATNTTEEFDRNLFNDVNLSLLQQYNSPQYPYEFAANVSTYITPIEDDINFVLKWNQSAQAFVAFSPLAATPQFDVIGGGEGQFILVSAAGGTNLTYNRSALDASI